MQCGERDWKKKIGQNKKIWEEKDLRNMWKRKFAITNRSNIVNCIFIFKLIDC